jgi:hypothetical protein
LVASGIYNEKIETYLAAAMAYVSDWRELTIGLGSVG